MAELTKTSSCLPPEGNDRSIQSCLYVCRIRKGTQRAQAHVPQEQLWVYIRTCKKQAQSHWGRQGLQKVGSAADTNKIALFYQRERDAFTPISMALYKSETKVVLRTCQTLFQESFTSWADVIQSGCLKRQRFVLKTCPVWFKTFCISFARTLLWTSRQMTPLRGLTLRLLDTSAFTLADASCFRGGGGRGCQNNFKR